MAGNYRDITFRSCVMGSYGRFYSDHVGATQKSHIFFDIGANQGLFTIIAAKNPFCVRAYAFEPVSDTFLFLKKNIALNQVEQKCSLVKAGIAECSGQHQITRAVNHSGAASLVRANVEKAAAYISEEIQVINAADLNRMVTERDIPISVKIDVEGYEPQVLAELFKTEFADNIFEVFFEVDERWVDAEQLIEFLKRHGFQQFERIGGNGHYDVLAAR